MMEKFFKSSLLTQAMIVALLAFAIHVLFQGIGFNTVMRNYCLGGQYFLQGADPYKSTESLGPSNRFFGSPFFALIAAGMAKGILNAPWLVLGGWILASTTLFAFGLRRWCDMSARAPFYVLFAFLAALTDLIISTGVYQINAIVTGLMLLGVAEYRDERYHSSGALLMLAANLKVYAVIFLAALLFRFRWQYWVGAFLGGVAVFILPAFWVGWTHNFNTHLAWVHVVLQVSGSYRILDMVSSFERVGLAWLGLALNEAVFIISLVVFFAHGIVCKRPDWRPWIAFGVAATLLVSPKTEVYTYVMLAPAYVFLFYWCRESEPAFMRKYGAGIVTILAVAGASCRFTDPTWYRSESTLEIIRVLSALGFWVMTGAVLARVTLGDMRACLGSKAAAGAK